MTWRTHVAVGMNSLWLAPLFGQLDKNILVLVAVSIVASLLPDIDAASAKIHYAGGGVLAIFRGAFYGKYFHHRGIMHSLPVAGLFFIILLIAVGRSYPALPYVFALSYLSHSLIDGLNTSVGYLYPFIHKRFAFTPKGHRARVGGFVDTMLMFAAMFALLTFFFLFRFQFIPDNLNF